MIISKCQNNPGAVSLDVGSGWILQCQYYIYVPELVCWMLLVILRLGCAVVESTAVDLRLLDSRITLCYEYPNERVAYPPEKIAMHFCTKL